MKLKIVLLSILVGMTTSCSKIVEEAIKNNPEIVFKAIESKPKEFFETIQKAQVEAQKAAQESAQKDMEKQLEEEFKNPKQTVTAPDRAVFGAKNAPVTIIEYSDFQCPYCSRAADTMTQVFKKYGDKVNLVYKHLPFKRFAEPAARYFEAIAMQDTAKAKKFHDELYANQQKINGGEDYLKEVAKSVGANLPKLMKDKDSKKVTDRINADKAEAQKHKISGTPGFIVNGVAIRGAYPLDHFVKIIDRHLAAKK